MVAAKKRPAAKKAPAKKPAARKRVAPAKPAAAATPPGRRRATLVGDPGAPATPLAGAASDYFARVAKEGVEFVSSGCTLIDCVLGGGWAMGRIVNVVGDRSAGKTLLAIEACANFNKTYPDGYIRYAEAEAAFDQLYAEALGLPEGKVDFEAGDPEKGITTVEDFHKDIERVLKNNPDRPILYVLDSLDALSDEAEAERDIDKGSFGASKAKKMGELFRRLVQRIENQRCLVIIISQLRDKIGVTFGEKQTRSGGRALDFYASQIVWLSEIGKLTKEMSFADDRVGDAAKAVRGEKPKNTGVKRIVGVDVRMKCKKNKVGLPFRECEYPVVFGYGVDDMTANVQWLLDVGADGRLKEVGMSKAGWRIRTDNLRNKGGQAQRDVREALDAIVRQEWTRIETKFLPQSKKY